MLRRLILTIKIPVPQKLNKTADKINRNAARVYSKTLSFVRKIYQKKGFWLSQNTVQRYILRWGADIPLHTHSKQAMVQQYFNALKSYFIARKSNRNARPPFRTTKHMPTIWKASAIHIKDTKLVFSNGRGNGSFVVPLPKTLVGWLNNKSIKLAKLVWDFRNRRYYIHLSVEVDGRSFESNDKVVAVDLGVIHPIAAFDGKEVKIWNGGILNSKLQYRQKRLADLNRAISKARKGSRKYKKLLRAKRRILGKLVNQINDILHKTTSNFIKWVLGKGASVIVMGDVTGIRNRVRYNKKANQKIHGWLFRRIANLIEYKAALAGIKIKYISEEYTSQTCPVCGHKYKPSDRNFRCPVCSFEYHRDGVGAINIYKKYTGCGLVVAGLAPAVGVRYNSHLRGPGISPWKLALSQ